MTKKPKVSIILLAYLESNKRYFDMCYESVLGLEYPRDDMELIIVSPWVKQESLNTHLKVTVIDPPSPGSFSKSVNRGMDHVSKDSKYVLMLSDDTVATRDSLLRFVDLAEAQGDSDALYGPLSNCDIGWRYHLSLPITENNRFYQIPQDMDQRELESISERMRMQTSPIKYPLVLPVDTICFYAFFIKCSTWLKIGRLNEGFNMGYEDTEYCVRAQKLGIVPLINMNALIYHAGGATGSIITDSMRAENARLFAELLSTP